MRDCLSLRLEQPLLWMAALPRLARVRLARLQDPAFDPLAGAARTGRRPRLGWRPPATKQLRRVVRAMRGTAFEL